MEDPALVDYLESFVSKDRLKRFEEVLSLRTKYLTVVMEDVYHLHNASAVIRSADIFGIQEVHVIERRFGKRLDKKIALGAQKWTDIHRYKSTEECLRILKKRDYTLVATTPKKDALPIDRLNISGKIAFLFGAEKEGLSDAALNGADQFVHIPMVGFTKSLNVSVAAAIILQQMTTKLRTTDLTWQLPDGEKEAKRQDWIKKSIKDIDQIIDRYNTKI
ncbi:RNA methyltransferase [uncultured Muriicola sp.]|uniref:TrmH family RNA methyltransferase n=1 Tax=uncultured Muriicola sp. TaxID=1583102 RepID=UPI00260B9878|nr:TrmH family RNA methyltransferase [uncultured Muriicola sp.]